MQAITDLAKLIPTGPNITIDYALETSKELVDEYENDEDVKTLIDHAKKEDLIKKFTELKRKCE